MRDGNGEFIDYYPDGKIRERGPIQNSQKGGEWTSYYPNGNLKSRSKYEGDRKFTIELWDKNGELFVKEGEGMFIETGDNDTVIVKGPLKGGRPEGEWNYYYSESGAVMQRITYVNGKQEGPSTSFYESGAIWAKGSYKNDLREGKWTCYHENGKCSSRAICQENEKHGLQIHYNSSGKKIREEQYEKGTLISERNLI